MRTFLLIAVAVIIAVILMPFLSGGSGAPGTTPTVASNESLCSIDKIEVKETTFKFVDPCKTRSCASMVGAATIINHCSIPVGVLIKLVGRDSSGNLVAVRDGWPASVSNIPPGEYSFSLDTWLDYDPAITSIDLSASNVKQW